MKIPKYMKKVSGAAVCFEFRIDNKPNNPKFC